MSTAMETILVIDDDENLRDTIGLMLESEKFFPIFASDGKIGQGHYTEAEIGACRFNTASDKRSGALQAVTGR
jgi:CheY-like chemotaxis protein